MKHEERLVARAALPPKQPPQHTLHANGPGHKAQRNYDVCSVSLTAEASETAEDVILTALPWSH